MDNNKNHWIMNPETSAATLFIGGKKRAEANMINRKGKVLGGKLSLIRKTTTIKAPHDNLKTFDILGEIETRLNIKRALTYDSDGNNINDRRRFFSKSPMEPYKTINKDKGNLVDAFHKEDKKRAAIKGNLVDAFHKEDRKRAAIKGKAKTEFEKQPKTFFPKIKKVVPIKEPEQITEQEQIADDSRDTGPKNDDKNVYKYIHLYLSWDEKKFIPKDQKLQHMDDLLNVLGLQDHDKEVRTNNFNSTVKAYINRLSPETGDYRQSKTDFVNIKEWEKQFEEENGFPIECKFNLSIERDKIKKVKAPKTKELLAQKRTGKKNTGSKKTTKKVDHDRNVDAGRGGR